MNVEIRGRHLPVPEALREYCERRVQFALGRFEDRIGRVVLRLLDVNGPRGGEDMCCQVDLTVRGRSLRIESTDSHLYAAVDGALARASRSVARELGRQEHQDAA